MPFTSHDFVYKEGKWSATFLNESKAISHLLASATNKDEAYQKMRGLCLVMRHSPDQLQRLQRVATLQGWIVPPESEWVQPEFL